MKARLFCGVLFQMVGAATFLHTLPAEAEPIVVFSNFGPGDTFQLPTPGGAFVPVGRDFLTGYSFTPSRDAVLSEVTVAISASNAFGLTPANTLTLEIWTAAEDDRGRPIPNTVLATIQRSLSFDPNLPPVPVTVESTAGLQLIGGSRYWLMASTEGGFAQWHWNSTGHFGEAAVRDPNEFPDWFFDSASTTGAFRIRGSADMTPVPEPTSVMLLTTGLSALLFARAKKRRLR
jgi:hypothetical protein